MKVVFFGTSNYCLPILQSLQSNFDLQLIVTRADKPVGRKKVLTPSATKIWALEHKIDSFTPETLKKDTQDHNSLVELIEKINPDIAIVSDFGFIIPETIFNLPRLKTFNIHFSKLPDLRGPSPVQFTLLRGEKEAWITIFELEAKMDTGPIVWQEYFPIGTEETTQTLYSHLFQQVATKLPEIIKTFAMNNSQLTTQNHANATLCRYLTKEDGFIGLEVLQMAQNGQKVSLSDLPEIQQEALKSKLGNENYGDLNSAENIHNFFRAVSPWPGMWTLKDEKRMKILKCHLERGKLVLDEVQFEGKNPTSQF